MHKLKLGMLLISLLSYGLLSQAALEVGHVAPKFTLKSLDGPDISLKELSAKGHVMLVFWETECVYCYMHIRDFNSLHQKYKDKGLTIAAINFLGEHEAAIREYVNDNQIKYLIFTDRGKSIDVASDYKVIGSPTIVVVAPDQRILYYGHKVPDIRTWIKQN